MLLFCMIVVLCHCLLLTKKQQSLYDRQLFVFGLEAMVSLSRTDFVICGLGGLGVEVGEFVPCCVLVGFSSHQTAK